MPRHYDHRSTCYNRPVKDYNGCCGHVCAVWLLAQPAIKENQRTEKKQTNKLQKMEQSDAGHKQVCNCMTELTGWHSWFLCGAS